MDERLKFVARLLDGKMTGLCCEVGISRKTGYMILRRYRDFGLDGLTDRSRRPYRPAGRLPFQVESRIVQRKKEHPIVGIHLLDFFFGAPDFARGLWLVVVLNNHHRTSSCCCLSACTGWL